MQFRLVYRESVVAGSYSIVNAENALEWMGSLLSLYKSDLQQLEQVHVNVEGNWVCIGYPVMVGLGVGIDSDQMKDPEYVDQLAQQLWNEGADMVRRGREMLLIA